jgi:formylglycine-generating enzyme required for sulfatase activity
VSWLLVLLACGGAPDPSHAPGGVAHRPEGPPPGMRLLSAAEDMASSWRPELQRPTPKPAPVEPCPDGMLRVPTGLFLMGSASSHAGKDEQPVHPVLVDTFCLDRTEVSARAVAAWYQASRRKPSGADPVNPDREGRALPGLLDHPAEGLSWQEASDYCRSRDARLPSEAEWEKAARGGCELGQDAARCDPEDLRPYPWGTAAPSCGLANHQAVGERGPRLCQTRTMPVDSLPEGAGPYGHLHMAGNVWEIVADAWHPTVYRQGRGTNPVGPPALPGGPRVLRGGGWNTFSTNMRTANRFHDRVMGSATGVRCASGMREPSVDLVQPLEMVTLSGTVQRQDGAPMTGRALYVTAFDAAETDPASGMPAPGRSPAAEIRLNLSGGAVQIFELPVPQGGTYRVSAALDDGTGGTDLAAAGSGGVGMVAQPVSAAGSTSGLSVVLGPPPGHRQHP